MSAFSPTPTNIRRWLVFFALIGVFYILWITRAALYPFAIGAIVAYIISPLVERMAVMQPWYARKPELARGIAVIYVYSMVLGILVIAGLLFVPRVIDEVNNLIDEIPGIVDEAQAQIDEWTERYQREVPEATREQLDQAIQDLGNEAAALAETIGKRSINVVFSTVTGLLGYISVPFFVFYALKDRDRFFGRMYSFFPEGVRPDVRECVRIANRVLGAYVRGQLFLGLVIFLITLVGLELMGIEFALALAVVAGITELIPIIGPLIGFIPAFIVVLATEPDKWWWVVLFYLGVQAAENYLLVPRIHSTSVNIHPAVILMLLAIGGALFGLQGVLIIVPLAAATRDVFAYIHRRLREEEERRNRPVTDST